ncbi:HET-domain-containing protein, partial [Thozetella sp. PMI_491]
MLEKQQYIDIIAFFLDRCRQNHSKCKKQFKNVPLPTRCIEVLEGGKSFRLVETEGQQGIYITLSHRWKPQTESCRTVKDTHHDRIHGRGFETLTKTFVKFLALVDKLGVRFAWIDFLCIIQDDGGADWDKESVKMAAYYQNSQLTIAAIAAASSTEDALFPTQLSRPAPRLARLLTANAFEEWVTSSDLMLRGWVYQEYALSRRITSISQAGIFYECQETAPMDDLGGMCSRKSYFDPDEWDLRRDSWYEVVTFYANLELTRFSDRIAALSGLAVVFSKL